MKVRAEEDGIDLIPETDFERQALERIARRGTVKCERIDGADGGRNWPSFGNDAPLRVHLPEPEWGT
jgi:hypothetical protein